MAAAPRTWVVYRLSDAEPGVPGFGVCEAAEWAELEQARPGRFTLVRAGFGSEPDAERFARHG